LKQVVTERFDRAINDLVLSGPGMFNIYKALAVVRGEQVPGVDAQQMTKKALNLEDKLSVDALDLYCTLLGRLAFNRGFTDKGKMTGKVDRIPVNLMRLKDQCLLGASVWLDSQLH
jgi:glucokinase